MLTCTFRSRSSGNKRDGCQLAFFGFEGKRQSEKGEQDEHYE
jgi:hypothetical protein